MKRSPPRNRGGRPFPAYRMLGPKSDEKRVAVIHFLHENSLYLLLGVAAIGTFLWLLRLRDRLRIRWYSALALSISHVICGVICVKLFAVLEGNAPADGAMSLFGAVFFLPVVYWLGARLAKRDTADVFDVFAVCMIFTLLCARVNCLIAGCCQGRAIPGLEPWRWPTREAELVFYVVFLAVSAPKVLRDESRGRVYPLYLISYGIVRIILECFRVAATDNIFHLSHVWAVMALAIGSGIYAELRRRQERKQAHKHTREKR